jgi:uncharacterized membrane protein (UPF0127 family)
MDFGIIYFVRRNALALLLLIFAVLFVGVAIRQVFFVKKTITVGAKKVTVEVAKSQAARERGLSGRTSLCENCGMLFLFPKADFYPIWMKGMRFDIDIIWILGSKVIGITPNVPYPNPGETVLPTFRPPQAVDAVLEVPSGWAQKNGIKAGSLVQY